MKLLFRQRIFSWFDSYDIFDENENTVFTVKGQLSFGHCLNIYDASGQYLATVKEKVLTFLPRFELYLASPSGNRYIGCIQKEFSFLRPKFHIDINGWYIEGNFIEWDYQVFDRGGQLIATVNKELFHFSDTYTIDIARPTDVLCALMLVLAIDAEKCSR
ncbi:MAG: LURP-one-related family protein [Lachnospiraceae bacterium]|nr:LURP-one-related family protein [Lachnospiraceae bacterium]